MKHTITKTISMIMVIILLLGAFAGCGDAMHGNEETTPSVNVGQNPDDLGNKDNNNADENDPTRVFTLDSLEPLSKEKQAEVEEAWREEKDSELLWCGTVLENGKTTYEDRYYGTFNDGVVIFHPIFVNMAVAGSMDIAGQKIKFGTGFEILIYKNGAFVEIKEAYESELLSDENIKCIAEYHEEFEEYRTGRR